MSSGSKKVTILWLLAQNCLMSVVLNRKCGRRLLQKHEINLKRNAIWSWQLIWSMWLSTFWISVWVSCWKEMLTSPFKLQNAPNTSTDKVLIKVLQNVPFTHCTAQVTDYNNDTHHSRCALCYWLSSAPLDHENQALGVHGNCSCVYLHVADGILLRWWSTANLTAI